MVIAFNRLPADKRVMKKRKMNRIVPLYIHLLHVWLEYHDGCFFFPYRMTEKLKELVSEIEGTDDLE